jgi:hypothetical protein
MYDVLHLPCITKHSCSWKRLAVMWGSCMTDLILTTAHRNCPVRRFLNKNTSLGYFTWETPRMNIGISWERKRLLNIVFQKLISYDFSTSFVLHEVKWACGGSKLKVELTKYADMWPMSLTPMIGESEWLMENWQPLGGKLQFCDELVSASKNLACRQKQCCCVTYIMICDRMKHKHSMEMETWGFDGVIWPFCCVLSALLSHHIDDLLSC